MAGAPIPVTAVIAAYNRADTVERAIRSVQGQTRAIAEILVVDDNSTDGTAEAAEACGATVARRAANGGAAATRNVGIARASQPWIAFLDSDDEWLPDALERLWPHASAYALVTGASLVLDDTSGATSLRGVSVEQRLDSPARLVYPDNFVSASGVLVAKQALLEAGGYDENLRFSEDFDLWLRVLARHPGIAIPEAVCRYHVHAGQKTSRADEARDAQRILLTRYRDQAWWSELAFTRRMALNECERRLRSESRRSAAAFLARGVLRAPRTYLPVGLLLARRRTGR